MAAEERDGGPAFLATKVSTTEREARVLIDRAGYQVVRRLSDMVLEPIPKLVPPPLPDVVELRPVLPDHYRAIYKAWKDAFAGTMMSTHDGQGARSLYERLGFREVKQHLLYRKPLHVHPQS